MPPTGLIDTRSLSLKPLMLRILRYEWRLLLHGAHRTAFSAAVAQNRPILILFLWSAEPLKTGNQLDLHITEIVPFVGSV